MLHTLAGQEIEMQFKPSTEQLIIGDALAQTKRNIVIDAKAGAGKTSTIELLTKALLRKNPFTKILMIAFNKSIVNELKERIDKRIEIRTSHSLGMKILNANASKRNCRMTLNDKKSIESLKVLVKLWEWDMSEDENVEKMKTIHKLCSLARLNLCDSPAEISAIATKHNLEIYSDEAELTLKLINVLKKDKLTIDFVDMIYKPAFYAKHIDFDKYDFVFVDECQDLNAAQQKLMINSVADGGRFIAVGDPSQSIYGFAGADADSFDRLTKLPNTVTLPLNKCYRCSKKIIKFVQESTGSNIQAFEGNDEGVEPRSGEIKELKLGDFVMCRNTYPLMKLCFHLLGQGIAAKVRGRDIGVNLQNIVKKSKRTRIEVFYKWLDNELDKTFKRLCKKNPDLTPDEIMELNTFSLQREKHKVIKLISDKNVDVKNCNDLIEKIATIFTDNVNGSVLLSTVHKAKGLEFDRCFVLQRDLMPSKHAKLDWQKIQERNIEYVCYTRAKKELIFIEDDLK